MIEEVFDNLVGQFSDPFTFLRELVQNSLDAGSNRVEVTVSWQGECAVVEVADDGEGMNRDIIDHQLTRLFSSSKENDLTKIGKFGIGFVSVFAIQPQLVLIDTGRAGEYWRVVFDGTTGFECLSLETPVEGTRIRVFKKMAEADFDEFTQRARTTISRWCRYSDSPVLFGGEALNERLAVDSPCTVEHERAGTHLVCGFTAETPPAFGMYNRGLTLREGHEMYFPGVTFRLKSRYLEHTLTRDNVLRDRNYDKALQIVGEVIRGALTDRLFEKVKELHDEKRAAELDELMGAASPFLANWKSGMPRAAHKRPLFPTHHHGFVSITDLRWSAFREGAVYVEAAPTPVSDALGTQGVPVLVAERADGGIAVAAQAVTGCTPRVASEAVASPPLMEGGPLLGRLRDALLEILRQGRRGVGEVRVADFRYPGSCVADLPCLLLAAEGDPVRMYQRSFWRGLKRGPGVLLLNAHHSLVRRALQTASASPLLAAFVLAKAALLQDGLAGDLEARLVSRYVREAQRA